MRLMCALRSNGLSVLAMLVLLMGTAAPALARMTCVAGGHSVLSVGQVEDCCPDEDAHTSTVSATCCEMWEARPQRSDFVPVVNAMVPLPVAMLNPCPLFAPVALAPQATTDAHISRPPPLPRAQRLASTGVFII